MNHRDVAELLTFIAAFDQRTLGDGDVLAWFEIANAQGWDLRLARRAVIEHYGVETTRIMPGHINASIAAARAAAAGRARLALPAPPSSLRDDPAAELAWTRTTFDELAAAELDAWAAGPRSRSLHAIEGDGG